MKRLCQRNTTDYKLARPDGPAPGSSTPCVSATHRSSTTHSKNCVPSRAPKNHQKNQKMTQSASLLTSCVAAQRHRFQYCLNHSLSLAHQRACQRPSQNCTTESPVFCTVCTTSPVSVIKNCTCIPPDSVLHCLDQKTLSLQHDGPLTRLCMSTGTSTIVDELPHQTSTCNCGNSRVFCTVNLKHLSLDATGM